MRFIIAVNPNSQSQSPTITIDSIGILLGASVSFSVLLGLFIKAISNFNEINSSIRELKEDLKNHANNEGHEKLILQVRAIQGQLNAHDKAFDIHLQDYQNRKETVQFLIGQLDQKINHGREKGQAELKETESEVKEVEKEIKELQKYLQKHEAFIIRENEK